MNKLFGITACKQYLAEENSILLHCIAYDGAFLKWERSKQIENDNCENKPQGGILDSCVSFEHITLEMLGIIKIQSFFVFIGSCRGFFFLASSHFISYACFDLMYTLLD